MLIQKQAIIALAFSLLSTLSYATPIVTFDESTGTNGLNRGQTVGWSFDVLDPISVTGLGWYDENQDGLGVAHEVGIWNSAGALLASTIVPAGIAGELDDIYRKVNISDITLNIGTGYVIGGLNFENSGDRLAANVAQVVNASVNFVDARFSALTANFERPTLISSASTGFYGPMMFVATVPAPSTLFLLLACLIGMRFLKKDTTALGCR